MAQGKISVQVLGAGLDVGRSCFLLRMGHRNILLDCGAHPGFSSPDRRYPDISVLPDRLDAILITHFHLDHAGALPMLHARIVCEMTPVFMTSPTRDLARLMLHDFWETSVARRQHTPYTKNDIDDVLNAAITLPLAESPSSVTSGSVVHPDLAQDVEISAWYAGHVLGAVMFQILVRGVGSVVYSGDYSTAADRLLRAAETPVLALRPDLLISESTYCGIIRHEPKSVVESGLFSAVESAIQAGAKILFPVGALGSAHEMIAAMHMLWSGERFSHVPVYVTAGLMTKANSVYARHARTWCSPGIERIMRKDAPKSRSGDERFTKSAAAIDKGPILLEFIRGRDWDLVTRDGPMILFATPGNMSTGVSFDVFREWCHDDRNLVVLSGFCFSNSVAARLLEKSEFSSAEANGGICCKLMNLSFSAHVDARGIIRTIRRLRPREVMLVHGDESKIAVFRPQLQLALGGEIPVHAPACGDVVLVDKSNVRAVAKKRGRAPVEEDLRLNSTCACSMCACRGKYTAKCTLEGRLPMLSDSYLAGCGTERNYLMSAGTLCRPVDDGLAVVSRLYAELVPEVEQVGPTIAHLRYRDSVEIVLDRVTGVIRLKWDHVTRAQEAEYVLRALDYAASPPSSPDGIADDGLG
jgi:integrator complex subunit 11